MKLQASKISIGHTSVLAKDITIEVNAGMCIALMGINGSGKSTLLQSLAGLLPVLGGEISIDQKSFNELPINQRSQNFSFVRSHSETPGLCTVLEFVLSGLIAQLNWTGLHSAENKVKANEILKSLGLLSLENRYVSTLSDGEKQKTSIARSLLANSPFIFLDEPVSFLDIPAKREIMTIIKALAQNGKAVIYSSHDLETSIKYSTHIWLLKDEELISGTSAEMTSVIKDYFKVEVEAE